jgi:hypothetical protein|tara:strand:+ start:634 stop:978 length:345 start_codon:yes stop_codon:yes gene_type:complete
MTSSYTCPLRMSDGRSITDYRPKSTVNYELIEEVANNNLVKSSYETRLYLQNNADKIMDLELKKSLSNLMPFTNCTKPNDVNGTTVPHKYIVNCDSVSCTKKIFDINGIGMKKN